MNTIVFEKAVQGKKNVLLIYAPLCVSGGVLVWAIVKSVKEINVNGCKNLFYGCNNREDLRIFIKNCLICEMDVYYLKLTITSNGL